MPRKPKQRCRECVWYHPQRYSTGRIVGTVPGRCTYQVQYPVLPECFNVYEGYLEELRQSVYANHGIKCVCFTRGEPDSGLKEANK